MATRLEKLESGGYVGAAMNADLAERFKAFVREEGRSQSYVLRKLLEAYLRDPSVICNHTSAQ